MEVLHLDPRLRTRLDASDVVQEAFLDVARDLSRRRSTAAIPSTGKFWR
jgi:hypothetical protein